MKVSKTLLKRLLILFVIAFYIIIPFIDSVACVDYMSASPHEKKNHEISHSNLQSSKDSLVVRNNNLHMKSTIDYEKEAQCTCPICLSNGGVFIHTHKSLVPVISFAVQPIFPSFSEPSFPINKPPQN